MEKKQASHSFPEIGGYIWLIAAVVTLLSLVTYDSQDLAFNTTHPNQNPSNFFGWVGVYWSGGLFFLLGMAAYLLPTLFLCAGLSLFFVHKIDWVPRLGWAAGFVVSLACLLHLQEWFGGGWALRNNIMGGPGGVLGQMLDSYLFTKLLSRSGSAVVLSLTLVVSGIYLFNVKPIETAKAAWQRFWAWRAQREQELLEQADPLEKLAMTEKKLEKQRRKLEKKLGKENPVAKTELEKPRGESAPVVSVPEPKVIDTTVITPEAPTIPIESKPKKERSKKETEAAALVAEAVPNFENYELPPLTVLQENKSDNKPTISIAELEANRDLLIQTLKTFNIDVQAGDITKGATITRYEVYPAPGVRVDRISSLQRDLARTLKAERINILAPIPGKDSVGIEVPNANKAPIVLRDLLETSEWINTRARIPLAIGKDVYGKTLVADLAEMPHLLIAGTTGSGKSVCINCILLSLLYKFSPEEMRLILIDPKQVEMQIYGTVPHLVVPVVTEPKKALLALRWVINEMEKRYKILAKCGVRNITSFNARTKSKAKVEELDLAEKLAEGEDDKDEPQMQLNVETPDDVFIPDRLPYIVVIIDEMADLMQTSPADVESAIARLAAKARAAGIHLILATQTPRREVITGVIKTNVPSRIAFQVPSALDSRVILDDGGAENLLGKGDLLYLPPGAAEKVRGQGAFVSDEEVSAVVAFVAAQSGPAFESDIHQKLSRASGVEGESISDEDRNLIRQCAEIIRQEKRASTSLLQRRLRIGYNRAAWVVDKLFILGVVGEDNGAKPRDILLDLDTVDFEELLDKLGSS